MRRNVIEALGSSVESKGATSAALKIEDLADLPTAPMPMGRSKSRVLKISSGILMVLELPVSQTYTAWAARK